jgi:urease gamma subunit
MDITYLLIFLVANLVPADMMQCKLEVKNGQQPSEIVLIRQGGAWHFDESVKQKVQFMVRNSQVITMFPDGTLEKHMVDDIFQLQGIDWPNIQVLNPNEFLSNEMTPVKFTKNGNRITIEQPKGPLESLGAFELSW